MTDQQLIDSGSRHLASCLDNMRAAPISGLYFLEQVLEEATLIKLQQYLDSLDPEKWQKWPFRERQPRFSIMWDPDTILEEIHEIFGSNTGKVNDICPGVLKHFWGISIWKDLPGHWMKWHTDNADIDVAAQIYVYTKPGVGTVFGTDENPVLVSSHHNSGYFVVQSKDQRPLHRTENRVPQGVTRFSLYAVWSRLPKHITNT